MLEVTCACGWTARGEEDALYEEVVRHGRDLHNMEVSREQMLAMSSPIES